MRIPVILISLIMLGLISFTFYVNASYSKQTETLQLVADRAAEQAMQLNTSLGYGGLIHNFKNAILRPTEPVYLAIARVDGAQTLARVKDLTATLTDMNVVAELGAVTDMVAAYMARLDQVETMHAQGLSATRIDEAVRYNDMAAIVATTKTLDAISAQKKIMLDGLEETAFLQNILGIITGLSALSMLFLYNARRTELKGLKALSTANADLAAVNASLDTSNGALKQFAGIASHDLRAPVRTVSMFTHAIIEERNDPRSVQEYGQMILELTDKMQALIVSLLDFTRNGFQSPEYEIVDLTSLARDVARDLDISPEGPEATLSVTALPAVRCDRILMARVFENLLSNSVKYASKTAALKIAISHEEAPGAIAISFSDNGIGIDTKYEDRIFEPLQRLHGDDSEYTGVGIGLALVKSILNAHGGTIMLDPQYTQGASFIISLPTTSSQTQPTIANATVNAESGKRLVA